MTTTQQSNKIREDWEKEFDKKFFNDLHSTGGSEYAMFNETKNVKDFIRKLLSTVQEETRKEAYLEGLDAGARHWAKTCGKEQSCSLCLERLGRVKKLASLTPTKTEECMCGHKERSHNFQVGVNFGHCNTCACGEFKSICQSTEKGKHE